MSNNLFKDLNNEGLEETQDRLGGFSTLDTDIYSGTLKLAYAITADSGARGIVFVFDFGGREYRETVWVTNKKGQNYFPNRDDPTKKVPLPGFTVADDICLCAVGLPLSEQNVEEKVVKLYDFDARKELPKSVPVLVDLIGKPISLGIVKSIENKSQKDNSGNYVAQPGTRREVNHIDKVFNTEHRKTVVEARDGTDSAFWDKWVEKNKGQTRDKREYKDDGEGGTQAQRSGPPQQNSTPAARTTLFGGGKK